MELVFCANGFLFSLLKKLLLWIFFVGFDWGSGVWRIIWNWVLKDLLDRERIVDCLDCFWINFFENDIMLRREF